MLALQGYGSGSEDEDQEKEVKSEVNLSPESSILDKNSVVSFGLQICAAPDVVPTVNIIFIIIFKLFLNLY